MAEAETTTPEPATAPAPESPAAWFMPGLQEYSARFGIGVFMTAPPIFDLEQTTEGVVILDEDAPIVSKLHRKQLDGRVVIVPCNDQPWAPGKCEFCRKGTRSKLRAVFTVYSLARKRREILLASDALLGFLTESLQKLGSLKGLWIELHRTSPRSPGQLHVGDEFRVVKSLTHRLSALERNGVPFNYKFIRPMTNDAMKQFSDDRKARNPEIDPGES